MSSTWPPNKIHDLLVSKLQHENIVRFVGYCYQVVSTSEVCNYYSNTKRADLEKRNSYWWKNTWRMEACRMSYMVCFNRNIEHIYFIPRLIFLLINFVEHNIELIVAGPMI
jgi:hypothetical protein